MKNEKNSHTNLYNDYGQNHDISKEKETKSKILIRPKL